MIKDKRGEGGFMEAMMAFMVVTVAMTAFLGMLAYSDIGHSETHYDLDTGFIEKLELRDGKIVGETDKHLEGFVEKNNYNGAKLIVKIAGDLCDSSLGRSVGRTDGNDIGTISGTFPISSDDGRTFVASYEVIYWWN